MKQSHIIHIIAIQEHWLYKYEKKNMSEFCTEHGFSVVLKSVDDTDILLPDCRPRGKGGVDTCGLRRLTRRWKLFTME